MKQIDGEFLSLSKRIFSKKAGSRLTITLFDCKCCLMACYGLDFTRDQIVNIWLSLPANNNDCLSDEDIINGGIDLKTFLDIAQAALESQSITEMNLATKIYETFDSKHKGFVSLADFQRVLESTSRMNLARNRAPALFHQLDDLNIQKISTMQLKAKLGR